MTGSFAIADPIVEDYDSIKGGKPPHHPKMMLTLLLYAYCVGAFRSRYIMIRCQTDVAPEGILTSQSDH